MRLTDLKAKVMNKPMYDFLGSAITAVLALVGVIVTNYRANKKAQVIIEYKIEELTREVREHNNFARRMPVVEEQIKIINHRIKDLEAKK